MRGFSSWAVAVSSALLLTACTSNDSNPGPNDAASPPPDDAGMSSPDAFAAPDAYQPDDAGEVHEGEITMGRLIVADSVNPTVRIVDLDEATVFDPMTIGSPARVYADPLGRYAYAVQSTAGRANIFDSGITFVSHLDHYHVLEDDPSMLASVLNGDRPIHFVIHGEEGNPNSVYASMFNDGSGILQILQERSLSTATPFMLSVASGTPHHGVGLVALGHVILSHPDPGGGSLPNGVTLRELATPDMVEDTLETCPGLHGEAANHHGVAFGCQNGVLFLEAHNDHFDPIKIDYPASTPMGVRTGTLATAHDLDIFVGNWEGGLVFINPEQEPHFTPVTVAGTILRFAFDAHGEMLIVLTADGNLHRLDPMTGAALGAPISVMSAFVVDPMSHSQVRPTFTLGAERVFVVDPRQTEVIEVHAEDWEIERRIEVGGAPGSVAIFSVSPDFGEEHHHDHPDAG